jgi:hypothetical protein
MPIHGHLFLDGASTTFGRVFILGILYFILQECGRSFSEVASHDVALFTYYISVTSLIFFTLVRP